MIIGLSGYAQSGKDTVAKILVDHYGFRRVAFADKIKEMVLETNPIVFIDEHQRTWRAAEYVSWKGWEKAKQLAESLNYTIDPDHIQDCLDTYRDWLYQRSTCPTCTNCSLQTNSRTYACFNCGTNWNVSSSRMCRPYRKLAKAI
jgi:hypothetical protein